MKKILITIIILLALIFSLLLYGRFIGIAKLKTNEIPITISQNTSYNGLKIVHFSDLHYKKVITQKRVKQLIKEINKIEPDIVIFTGDLLDKNYTLTNKDINFLIQQLSNINTKYGAFAIMGDNDYSNEEEIKNIYIQSKFTLLKQESTIIYNENNEKIYIGGLDSYSKKKANINELNNSNDTTYKIILIHEPDYIDEILKNDPNINLILSGHSINGSINIPGIKQLLLPTLAKKYYQPHYKINNTDIYISNGIGVNNINFRLFNPPSINFYRFIK